MLTKERLKEIKTLMKTLEKERESVNGIENWKFKLDKLVKNFLVRKRDSTMPKASEEYLPRKIRMFFNNKKVRVDLYLKGREAFFIVLNWGLASKLNFHNDKLSEVKTLFYFLDDIIIKLEKRCKREEYLEGLLEGLNILKEKTKGVKFDYDIS